MNSPSLLLERIESRVKAGFVLTEWANSGASLRKHSLAKPIKLDSQGSDYLVLENPSPVDLWGAFAKACELNKTLVILPPATNNEKLVFLRQLPKKSPEKARLALFSSGTTGEPKAVLHSEASLLASSAQLGRAFSEHERRACLLAAWGMAGISFHFLLPLALGGESFFSRETFLYWAATCDSTFTSERISLLVCNPFQHAGFLRAESNAWQGTMLTLTAPMKEKQRAEHKRLRHGPLREIYGLTEAAGPVLLDGKSLGAELRLEKDELLISGAQLCLGYAREGKFEALEGFFATGDHFSFLEGLYRFEARFRELIDIGGRKIPPRLLEEIFEAMPEINEALAFAWESAGQERAGLVYVRARECKLSREALSLEIGKRAKEFLSEDLRPVFWRELENLPRLPNGKPDRKSLRLSS